MWWYEWIFFLHNKHFPFCWMKTASSTLLYPASLPCWYSQLCMLGFSIRAKSKRFTSITIVDTGKNDNILLTALICVCKRWLAVGVSQPFGRFLCKNLAWEFLITLQRIGFLQPGNIRQNSVARAIPVLSDRIALRCLAFRSPRLDACLESFLSLIRRCISLFRVTTSEANKIFPYLSITQRPILVLPGSIPRRQSSTTGLLSCSFIRMVNGFLFTTCARFDFNNFFARP